MRRASDLQTLGNERLCRSTLQCSMLYAYLVYLHVLRALFALASMLEVRPEVTVQAAAAQWGAVCHGNADGLQ